MKVRAVVTINLEVAEDWNAEEPDFPPYADMAEYVREHLEIDFLQFPKPTFNVLDVVAE